MTVPSVPDCEDVVRRRLVGLGVLLRGEEDVLVPRHRRVERVDATARGPTKSCETMCGNTMMSRRGKSGIASLLAVIGALPSPSLLKNMLDLEYTQSMARRIPCVLCGRGRPDKPCRDTKVTTALEK